MIVDVVGADWEDWRDEGKTGWCQVGAEWCPNIERETGIYELQTRNPQKVTSEKKYMHGCMYKHTCMHIHIHMHI